MTSEVPQRAALLTVENTGYSGDPRLAVNQIINDAPKGTWYLGVIGADYTLWYKTVKTDSTAWEQVLGVAGFSEATRENILLTGTYDGVNKDFYLPEYAIYDPPRKTVRVYHNGRRLLPTEYEVLESVPGSGYNLIRIKMFTPNSTSKLYADYFVM
jgi:hypothetical protein